VHLDNDISFGNENLILPKQFEYKYLIYCPASDEIAILDEDFDLQYVAYRRDGSTILLLRNFETKNYNCGPFLEKFKKMHSPKTTS
jgi:hypothetical protein